MLWSLDAFDLPPNTIYCHRTDGGACGICTIDTEPMVVHKRKHVPAKLNFFARMLLRSGKRRHDAESSTDRRSSTLKEVKVKRATTASRRLRKHGIPVLCEVAEKRIMSFLPMFPDRLSCELVCTRWRELSLKEVPVYEMNFEATLAKSGPKHLLVYEMLRRKQELQALRLAAHQRVDDAAFEVITAQKNLCSLSLYRYYVEMVS